ncbi:hypothetical protein IFR05_005336 [Cadophora sp. M221]|nr:hypothetical protein IFR05_005336 [Cadophora sp. M221]
MGKRQRSLAVCVSMCTLSSVFSFRIATNRIIHTVTGITASLRHIASLSRHHSYCYSRLASQVCIPIVDSTIRMALFNTNSPQQTSPTPGQAGVPIHRESLVSIELTQATSRRASVSMAQQGHVMSAYNATLPPSAHPQSDGGNEGLPYNDWMSQFCVEPQHDTSTCCLGFWVPCALYGKTHWRLKQINRGKDASDSKWQLKDGCNTACWAWCGLAGCLSMPISGIITGIQRAQIRGTYGIKGNCASDIALGMVCPSCTQMQNDREIRAREGDVRMRYNPKYLKTGQGHQLVNTQPLPTQPMSYNYAHLAPATFTGAKTQPERSEKPNKLQKTRKPPVSGELKPESHRCKIENKKRPTARELESQRQAKKKALVQNAPKILVTQHQDQPLNTERSSAKAAKSGGKKAGIFGKFSSTKQETIPEETTRESMKPLSEQHTLVECDVVEVEDPANNRQVQVTHTLVECTKVDNPSSEKSKSAGPQEHMIMECTTVQEKTPVEKESSGPPQHMIEDCETVVIESSPSSVVEEHPLKDCDTVPVSEDEPPAQELSYVHDFTDCPVDKAILDYYEREEKKAKQHELTDCIRTSLPIELLQVNQPSSQHTLAECSEDENTPPGSPSNYRSTSYNFDRNNKDQGSPRQHRLVSCPTPPVLSHHVAENALTNASEDSQATQRPIYNDKLRAEELSKSTDGVSSGSGSGDTNSGGSTEDPANSGDGVVRRKQRRRHKQNRKVVAKFPATASNENKPVPVRSGSAQYSLEQVLAANGGKREKPQKGSDLDKSSKQKGKNNESSAATIGENSGEGIRSEEDPRSPGVVQNGVSGLWSKLTTPTKEKNEQSWS